MKPVLQKSILFLVAAACFAWSVPSQACGTEDYISSICPMAASGLRDFGNQFMIANGRSLPVNSFAALYALIGRTYGSLGNNSFNIPDLRGRSVIGAGQGPNLPNYSIGQVGGNISFTLTVAQLPPHSHSMTGATFDLSHLSVALSGLTGTADLSGVTISGPATGLTIKVNSTATGSIGTPGNAAYLGKASYTQGAIYNTAAPDTNLNPGSIGGTINLTIPAGKTAPVTVTGGSGGISGTLSESGNTGLTGSGQAVPFTPPYVAMNYYIAVVGMYPSND